MKKTNSLKYFSGHRMLSDKTILRTILEAQDEQSGFVVDTSATPFISRGKMTDQGVRAEDNEVSCAIRRMREGD